MRVYLTVAIIFMTIFLFRSVSEAQDQNVDRDQFTISVATSVQTGHVVLTWPGVVDISYYNIYRKTGPLGTYTAISPNPNPIHVATAAEIPKLIPDGTVEAGMVDQALEDSGFTFLNIPDIPRDSEEFRRLQLLARGNWKIAVAIGQGYEDKTVTKNTTYYYEIREADEMGLDIDPQNPLATDIKVTAGVPVPPPPPTDLVAQAGESRVLLLWKDVQDATATNSFVIYRSQALSGPYDQINDVTLALLVHQDLEDKKTTAVTYPKVNSSGSTVGTVVYSATPRGFLDMQEWDKFGNPTTHLVHGKAIGGPTNGVTFYYKVAGVDILQQPGPPCSAVPATPLDETSPMAPKDVKVTANDAEGELEIRWLKVTHDIDGHREAGINGYNVYRYEVPDATDSLAVPINTTPVAQPAGEILYVTIADSASILRPLYGEKTFWYRVECEDGKNNKSARSVPVPGHLRDIYPPSPPRNLKADGFNNYIKIQWNINSEPDMDGYLIYRSQCHLGQWVKCPPTPTPSDRPIPQPTPVPCSGPFVLLAYLSQEEAELISGSSGTVKGKETLYEDVTIPKGSPLCYAYLVKAQDESQNRSGSWPIPDLKTEEIVCQRLRDKMPPEPAIIAGLSARDGYIEVEWIGEPIQDIGAYHVYRSEKEAGPYEYVGGKRVEIPSPTPGQPPLVSAKTLIAPASYQAQKVISCKTIPINTREDMSYGCLKDRKNIEPKKIYWYKVVGIDQLGNECSVTKAVPVSTFTFATKELQKPSITSVVATSSPCALEIAWSPGFNPTLHLGFALFRREGSGTPFRQLGSLLTANKYVDKEVVRGVQYWYQVRQVGKKGNMSDHSEPVSGMVSP